MITQLLNVILCYFMLAVLKYVMQMFHVMISCFDLIPEMFNDNMQLVLSEYYMNKNGIKLQCQSCMTDSFLVIYY